MSGDVQVSPPFVLPSWIAGVAPDKRAGIAALWKEIATWQAARGLVADGLIGPKSWNLRDAELEGFARRWLELVRFTPLRGLQTTGMIRSLLAELARERGGK